MEHLEGIARRTLEAFLRIASLATRSHSTTRSSSREVRIRLPVFLLFFGSLFEYFFFLVAYFSRGTLPKETVRQGTNCWT